jgi:DNA repair exonuclease SbcCD nuclease subunit
VLRILLLADTHLGLDLPTHPRVDRRRRGDDFFDNFRRALEPALAGEVDLVVHGGDLLFRSQVRPWLVQLAFQPLFKVADRVPVFLVPGNHERSAIPWPILGAHPRIHVFDRPRTYRAEVRGCTVALAGFPFVADIGLRFGEALAQTGWDREPAAIRLLCMHQTVEGARVGPVGYTFRPGPDVLGGRQIPPGFAAVLSGHIHRGQVLTRDLAGRSLAAPVLYPGSVERTSRAERDERKGYLRVEVDEGVLWRFVELPARPMVDLQIDVRGFDAPGVRERIAERLAALDAHAIVRLKLTGESVVSDAQLRELAPATMNVELDVPRQRPARSFGTR